MSITAPATEVKLPEPPSKKTMALPSTPTPTAPEKPATRPGVGPNAPEVRPSGKNLTEKPSKGTARLALIIDDVGMSTEQLRPFLDLKADLTFAIIPETRQARRCLSLIQSRGRLPILHLPMEPHRRKDLLPASAITVDLSSEEIERRVSRHLSELKGVRGVNNHMGSRATQDPRVMQSVLGVVRDRGLFFVDSKTSEETVVTQVARQLGVPYATRTGEFLDDGGDTSRTYEIVLELGREAQRRGSAIGIGHPHSGTARAIARALPELQAMGVRIVPVSELTR